MLLRQRLAQRGWTTGKSRNSPSPVLPQRLIGLIAALALSAGCVTVQAAAQSIEGELQLLSARKPIGQVIADPRTPLRARVLLAQISRIKQYGEANGLKPTENYQQYVNVHRPAVVYVVTACEPLRFQPKTWGFPIAGQFPYLGWFQLGSALDLARELEGDGLDVDVRGTTAFSTLGFFHDPVLSTMISTGPEALGDLVDVVLHESVHATLHFDNQSPFNESLASFIADHLTQRYLAETPGVLPLQRNAWQEQQARYEKIAAGLHEGYVQLQSIYLSGDPDSVKRARKAEYLAGLRARLLWKGRLNNATLMGQRTYSSGSKGFDALMQPARATSAASSTACGRWAPAPFPSRRTRSSTPSWKAWPRGKRPQSRAAHQRA